MGGRRGGRVGGDHRMGAQLTLSILDVPVAVLRDCCQALFPESFLQSSRQVEPSGNVHNNRDVPVLGSIKDDDITA